MDDTDDLPGYELKHKQVPVTDRDADTVFEVDAGIQNLVQYLFDKGIKTFNSCEDHFDGEDSIHQRRTASRLTITPLSASRSSMSR